MSDNNTNNCPTTTTTIALTNTTTTIATSPFVAHHLKQMKMQMVTKAHWCHLCQSLLDERPKATRHSSNIYWLFFLYSLLLCTNKPTDEKCTNVIHSKSPGLLWSKGLAGASRPFTSYVLTQPLGKDWLVWPCLRPNRETSISKKNVVFAVARICTTSWETLSVIVWTLSITMWTLKNLSINQG